MNTHTISIVYGVIFVAVGILGLTPNPVISEAGFFAVNPVHNLIHVALGAVFIAGALRFPGHAGRLLKLLGLGGIAVTILGFSTEGNMLLGLIYVNHADHWLHLGLALIVLVSGFVFSDRDTVDKGLEPRLHDYWI